MCVERGKDATLHGSRHFLGGAHFPGEGPTLTDGTTDLTDGNPGKVSSHIAHSVHTVMKTAKFLQKNTSLAG